MPIAIRSRAAIAAAAAVALTVLSGCAYDVYHTSSYARTPAHYRPVYNYDYHYYPNTRVYFHLSSGYYYYRPYNTWLRVRTLPPNIYLAPQERVQIRVWTARPYVHHDIHRQRYHPHPGYTRDRRFDRYERRYNSRYHQEYLRRYRR
jgi:hypothetical protein